MPNSDKQNALLLGLDVKFPLKDTVWSFYGNFDGIITFEGKQRYVSMNETINYDYGDYFIFSFGASRKFIVSKRFPLNVGLDLVYKLRTEGRIGSGTDVFVIKDGYNLSLVPYLAYKVNTISIWLKLGFVGGLNFSLPLPASSGEYSYYGISLVGRNELATLLGFTLGLSLSF